MMAITQDFFAAIKAGNTVEVTRLLDADRTLANVKDENGLSAVLTAAYYQEPDIARLLVQRGAELSVFEACAVGELARVKDWVEQQPEWVNAYASDGFQPLGLAAFFGHADIVEFLLSKGADVNSPSRNPMRVMPLHSAIANRHTEIVRLLLDQGADVNATQADDFTPLHEAAQNGMLEVAQWLLDRGAAINPRLSSNGKTPLALASEHKHEAMANLLKQHGATA
jgi:ankyrin repeat protein